jgi:choline dehydrogenase-like flavoprotein
MNGVPHNEDGASGMHLYMPWWLDNRALDFPRGYHIEIGGGRRMPSAGFLSSIHRHTGTDAGGRPIAPAGYGKALKADYRRFYGARVGFSGRGEMVPNEGSYCEIDPNVVDRWGIPVLRFHFKWTDYELNQVRHMQRTFRALIDQMGGTPLTPMPTREMGYGIEPGGRIIHEVGVTRMGQSPTTSVLNAQCQAHDVKNLFVADGGPFVTNADKNVTWTILALAMRTATYIADQRKAGTI